MTTTPAEILSELAPGAKLETVEAGPDMLFVAYPHNVILPLMQLITRLNSLGWLYEPVPFNSAGWSAFKLTRMVM